MGMLSQLPDGTILAAFQASGYGEGCNDQAIFLTTSSDGGATWSPHTVAANGTYACWGSVMR